MRALGRDKRNAFYNTCIGNDFSVLTQGWFYKEEKLIHGISDNYLRVIYNSSTPDKNSIITVRMEEVNGDHIKGRPA